MKKLIYIVMGLGLFFSACDPLDDIYGDLDTIENPVVGDANYTLTAADYSTLKLTSGSFSSLDDAKAKLPDFFAKKYPVWGKGSSILANFKLYVGNAPGVSTYTGAAVYNLQLADYALSGSAILGFYPNVNPSNYLADILAANITAPTEGQIELVKYTQYTEVPVIVSSKIHLDENFDYGATAGDLTTISGGNWSNHSGTVNQLLYNTTSLSMANYPSTAKGGSLAISASGAEDVNRKFSTITSGKVYASALVNLSTVGTGTYFFHFIEPDAAPLTFNYTARIGAKDNGSGKILFGIGASSSTLTYGTTAFDLNTTYLLVSSYDIATGVSNLYVLTTAVAAEPATPVATNTGNPGLSIQKIAVRQAGGGPTATIDGIRVASSWTSIMSNDVIEDVITGNKISDKKFYTNTGGVWKEATNGIYLLVASDYDSMGTASGQPGQYNNFSSSISPDGYLPTFLKLKYPYALEGTKLFVIYDYFSSSTGAQLRGNLYTVTNGVWVGFQTTINSSLQFGHDGSTWVPDNTIKYTLIRADYTLIGSTLKTLSGYETAGASAENYGNFDRRVGNAAYWSNTMLEKGMNLLLSQKDPSAAVGQKYTVSFAIYNGSAGIEELKLIKNTSGSWVLNN